MLSRPKIDIQVRCVVGKVVGIDSAAVPYRHKDVVGRGWRAAAAGTSLTHAVDVRLARGRVPGVDRVATFRREIRAIHFLKRDDVVHHERCRIAICLIGIAGPRAADIAVIGHHRVFERIVMIWNVGATRTGFVVGML